MVSVTFLANPTGEHIQSRRVHRHREFRSPEPSARHKRVPSTKKCVRNAYPQPENPIPRPRRASKTRTLSQKVRQKHVPLGKKSAPIVPRDGNEPLEDTVQVRVKRRFCQITRVFSCILRHVGSDPQAERGRGEVNLSPTRVLTLRPRVGGFYVSGRLWEAQFVLCYASGRFWEVQFVVFFTLRAVPPTQHTFIRVISGLA